MGYLPSRSSPRLDRRWARGNRRSRSRAGFRSRRPALPIDPSPTSQWSSTPARDSESVSSSSPRRCRFRGVSPFSRTAAMLVAERPGSLRLIRNGVLDPQPVPARPTGVLRPASQACRERCTATWTWCSIRSSRRTVSSISPTPSHSMRNGELSASRAGDSTARRSPT